MISLHNLDTTDSSRREGESYRTGVMTSVDWTLVLLLCGFLFALSTYRSRTRLFWADELISYQIFSDPSFFHRLHAWYRGADSGGLTYYLLCPLWLRLFGLSELSLRLFSTAGMCVGLALVWLSLRRYVSVLCAAVAVGVVFFTSPAMLWQELNGRFYGLYFAFAALASFSFLAVTERPFPSRWLLALLFVAHAGLVGSHIFGILFSFSLVAGSWAADRLRGRTRWSVYLAPAAGWMVVLISLPALRASSSVVGKIFWTRKPDLTDLFYSFAGYGRGTAIFLGGLLCAAALRVPLARLRRSFTPLPAVPLAPAALVGSLVLGALLFFFKSQTGASIFADRYLLPLSIATAFAIGGALSLLLPPAVSAVSRRPAVVFSLSLLLLLPCVLVAATRQTNSLLYPTPIYLQHVRAQLRPHVPVVADLPVFPFLRTYDPGNTYLFMTNWAYDNDPTHPADYSGARLMENWKRAGYADKSILPCTELFARYSQLDLLITPMLAPWFNDRLLHNPHFRVTPAGVVHEWNWVDIWRVDRVSPGPPPC